MNEKDWEYAYHNAVDQIGSRLKFIRGIITAYNTNIDSIYLVQPKKIERLVNPLSKDLMMRIENQSGKIIDQNDFLAGLIINIRDGLGEEWLILDQRMFDWIIGAFGFGRLQIGGQVGNMTNALAKLGIRLIIPHIVQLPELQARLFMDQENIRIPRFRGEGIELVPLKEAVRPKDKKLIHFVFEFQKGLRFSVGDEIIQAPKANRFVATYDEYNTRLEVDKAFLKGFNIPNLVDGAIISGYHLLRRPHAHRIDVSGSQLKNWRRINPNLKIHLELGKIQDDEVAIAICSNLSPFIDSLGLNEYELIEVIKSFGESFKPRGDQADYTAVEILWAAERLFEFTRIKRIIIHTKDFNIGFIQDLQGSTPESEFNNLLFGSAVAAVYANTGRHSSIKDLNCELNKISLSNEGLEQFREAGKALSDEGESFFERGFAKYKAHWIIFSVNKTVENPIRTTGLGDCFTAGVFASYLTADKSDSLMNGRREAA